MSTYRSHAFDTSIAEGVGLTGAADDFTVDGLVDDTTGAADDFTDVAEGLVDD
jgi:hypothetical protein